MILLNRVILGSYAAPAFLLLSGVRRACGRCVGGPEGSAPEAILSEAGLSLAEARRIHFRSEGCCWLISSSGRQSPAGPEQIIQQPGERSAPDL